MGGKSPGPGVGGPEMKGARDFTYGVLAQLPTYNAAGMDNLKKGLFAPMEYTAGYIDADGNPTGQDDPMAPKPAAAEAPAAAPQAAPAAAPSADPVPAPTPAPDASKPATLGPPISAGAPIAQTSSPFGKGSMKSTGEMLGESVNKPPGRKQSMTTQM